MKKIFMSLVALVLLLSILPFQNSASAASGYTFDSFQYADSESGENSVLQYVYLKNVNGYKNRFRVDNNTVLKINNTPTVPDGFKYGMDVQFKRNSLGKIIELQGISKTGQGAIVENSKEVSGIVTKIDPNGMFIELKLNSGKIEEYYINKETQFFKGTESVDFSYMYEGDRVKIKFASNNTKAANEVEIYQDGLMIENLYRGKIQMVNTTSNRLTVKNSQPFVNWEFGESSTSKLKTFKFDNNTTIYYGNRKITKSNIRKYTNSDAYFVTTNVNGTEIVKKIVIIQNFERTYFNELTLVNTKSKYFKLNKFGLFYFHNGSILVRNGRLIEPASLTSLGSAFVITDGITQSNYSHVVNVVNDSFLSPNLASHELYFGELTAVSNDKYTVNVDNLIKLDNNYWKPTDDVKFAYSNNTVATRSNGSIKLKVTNLNTQLNKYGYFYVKDGHVQAVHFVNTDQEQSSEVITGRVASVDIAGEAVEVKNLSQWSAGTWVQMPSAPSIDLAQAVIVKNGKIVTVSDIKQLDRIVLLTDSTLQAHIVLVNE